MGRGRNGRRAAPGGRRRTALELLAVPGLLALVVAAARMPILTPDVWWHLATGRLIAETGIPNRDPFSYTLAGQRWIPHEWLADLLLYGIYARGGLLAVVLARAILLGSAFAVAYAAARLYAGPGLALVLLAPAAYASQRNWLDRPQLWSYVAAAFVLWMLERARRHPGRSLFLLPFVFALWVNLHGGFMLGLALVFLWTASAAWEWWRQRGTATAQAARRYAAVLGLCALAALANPNGFDGAVYPLRYVTAGLAATVQEEQPGQLDSAHAWVHFGLVVALWMLFLLRRRGPLAHVALGFGLGWISMPGGGGAALPFAAERHAPLFLLLGTPLLVWQLAAVSAARAGKWQVGGRMLVSRWASMATAAISVAAAARLLAELPRDGSPEARLLPGRYPVEAAAWLRGARLPGHLINPYRWGGYLAFTLYPPTQVWIDSRGDLYGAARLRESQLLQHAPAGSEAALGELLARYDANVIVWPLVSLDFGSPQVHPFTEFLLHSGEWRLVFYDRPDPRRPQRPAAVAAVFLREHARNAEWLARHAPLRLPPLPRATPRPTPRRAR